MLSRDASLNRPHFLFLHCFSCIMVSEIVPHEREVMDFVIKLWREQPHTERLGVKKLHALVKEKNPSWSVSEKRLKSVMKQFNLLPSPEPESLTYAKHIVSQETPNLVLPDKVHLVFTSKRGKGLFAKNDIEEGELIWEEHPLFLVPPLGHAELMMKGSACTYCGKLVRRLRSDASIIYGEECKYCPEVWCSKACQKRGQKVHSLLKHSEDKRAPMTKKINSNGFLELLKFCVIEQWNALFAITMIVAEMEADQSRMKEKQFDALAKVSQRLRLNVVAKTSTDLSSSFLEEQHENLWEKAYTLFLGVFPHLKSEASFTYENFLVMLGAYNINNLDSCIYLIQSHLNHNCSPNTTVETGDSRAETIKVYSSRFIRAGEEITTTYVNPAHLFVQRQSELRTNWGFLCKCTRCKKESSRTGNVKPNSDLPLANPQIHSKTVRFDTDGMEA